MQWSLMKGTLKMNEILKELEEAQKLILDAKSKIKDLTAFPTPKFGTETKIENLLFDANLKLIEIKRLLAIASLKK